MNVKTNELARRAFEWSLLRLVIAAISLLLGATPIAYKIFGQGISSVLLIFWIISGIASLYLGYLWYKCGMKLFGKTDTQAKVLFLVLVVSGINLGWTGLVGRNVGMSLVNSIDGASLIFQLTALLYLYTAYTLWTGWRANNKVIFAGCTTVPPLPETSPASTPVTKPTSVVSTPAKEEETNEASLGNTPEKNQE